MTDAPDIAPPEPTKPAFESFSAIMEAFGDRFAEAIGVEPGHARTLKARGRIPPGRWRATVKGAEAEGIPGITLELLADLEERRLAPREADAAASAGSEVD